MRVCVVPNSRQIPPHGGVREHMLQLYKCIAERGDVQLVTHKRADIIHVESAFGSPDRVDVYVCHGGFVPTVLPVVRRNLKQATVIISVSEWIVHKYFPDLAHKTIVIPNGINLSDWSCGETFWLSDYVLYAKHYEYEMYDYCWLVRQLPHVRFVTTVWPDYTAVPSNVVVMGLLTKREVCSLLRNATFLMLAGDEVCPTMLLEAWACGTPVLARKGTGAEELMRSGRFPTGISGGALYEGQDDLMKMVHWLTAEGNVEGQLGYERVKEYFQWGDIFEKYVEVYNAIVEGKIASFLQERSVKARSAQGIH